MSIEKPTYSAVIIGHALTESKNNHTPEVAIRVRAEKNLDSGDAVNKEFTVDLWLTEKTSQRTADTLRAIGFQGNSYDELNTSECLVGVEVEVSTSFEEWNGVTRERASFLNPRGNFASRGFRKLDANYSKSIASKYDAVLKTTKKSAPPVKKSVEPPKKDNPYSALDKLDAQPVNAAEEDLLF